MQTNNLRATPLIKVRQKIETILCILKLVIKLTFKHKRNIVLAILVLFFGWQFYSVSFGTPGKRAARAFEKFSAPANANVTVYYIPGSFPNCFDACDNASFSIRTAEPLPYEAFKAVIDETISKKFVFNEDLLAGRINNNYAKNVDPNCTIPKYIADEYPGTINEGDPCSNTKAYYILLHYMAYKQVGSSIPECATITGSLKSTSFDKNGFDEALYNDIYFSCNDSPVEDALKMEKSNNKL